MRNTDRCPVPDHIPGSLPDAVERLREKVEENWYDLPGWVRHPTFLNEKVGRLTGREQWDNHYLLDTPRQRFVVFAEVLIGDEE